MHLLDFFCRTGPRVSTCSFAIIVLATGVSRADNIQARIAKDETVTNRPHPETDALGIRFGSFMLLPSIATENGLNDNVFVAHTGGVGDDVTTVSPEVTLRSDWENNIVTFSAHESSSFYARYSGEDTNNYGLSGFGRLDISRDDFVSLKAEYSLAHEPRSSPDNTFGITPTEYSTQQGAISTFDKFNRLSLNSDSSAKKIEYTNVPTSLGNYIQQKDRDRWEYSETVRLGYEIQPEYEATFGATVNDRAYVHSVDSTGYMRSSLGGDVMAGVAFDLTGLTFGEVSLGYMSRRYQDKRFSPIQGVTGRASLTWNPTTLMTVRLDGSRTIDETVVVGASGVVNTAVTLTADHELLRQLLINLRVGATQANYSNNPQHQVTFVGDFGATYLYDQKLHISAKYSRTNCISSNETNTFAQNIIMLRLVFQM